jgi:hypothetical protein
MADWRQSVDAAVAALARWLREHELLGPAEGQWLDSLHERLQSDQLLLAFVAEFSRGKSELINAIFFGDSGVRVLPATPGRTTMCPVELRHDRRALPSLLLLPIETRLRGLALADLRGREEAWTRIPLEPSDPAGLKRALAQVTRTRPATIDEARALGLWNDDHPEDNPPVAADGTVEVPVWRHAVINYPHPLLERGLVVVDTPGLNAIGAEPELTLGLLPAAHAVVFVLGADTGVTRSDLEIWRHHLGARALQRHVVLNKIDTLADPLATPATIQAQIAHQREQTARTLGIGVEQVFPLSAREALAARLAGDEVALARSRLPELEAALSDSLLPGQHELLSGATRETLALVRGSALRNLADRRRQNAEQMLELRGLRGKSGPKLRLMRQRAEAEREEFERCSGRLLALRAVLLKMMRAATHPLRSDELRHEVAALPGPAGPVGLGTQRAFGQLCARLRHALTGVRAQSAEMAQMLDAAFRQLNAEFGFSLAPTPLPSLEPLETGLQQVERDFGRQVGATQAWRLAGPGAMEHFRRLLLARLRELCEGATSEIELWSRAATGHIELQLRERRHAFDRRQTALGRIEQAAGELEARIAEVEQLDLRLREMQQQLEGLLGAAEAAARAQPGAVARRDAA